MPYIYVPSSEFSGNRPTSSYAHQTHGTMGVLAKGTDPRNRGRRRSRSEIEASSRSARVEREKHLAELRTQAEARKEAEAAKRAARLEAVESRKSQRASDLAAVARAAGAPGHRVLWRAPKEPAAPSPSTPANPSDALSLMGPERSASATSGTAISDILNQPIATPHTTQAVSNLFRHEAPTPTQPLPTRPARREPEGLLEFAMNPSGRPTPNPLESSQRGFDMQELAYREHPEIREPVSEQHRRLQLQALPYGFPVGLARWYGLDKVADSFAPSLRFRPGMEFGD